ncbi:MAG: DUF4386 domain-containing protein [Anaerolineae bacterium]|nr:DUF4386 domain-containing protein [Anaerolineae bacterium]
MSTTNNTSKVLGAAFLLQFVTSFSSGMFLKQAWFVPGNIGETMLKIADNPWLMRANILVDMLTALGVTFLGVILFITLRKQNEKMALTSLGFYILEAALLAVSRIETFSLLRIGQEYASAGQPTNLLLMGQVAYESMDFVGNTLHMLVFCPGGILFYYLLDKSRIVPRVLSLWGLITVFPMLIGTVSQIFGFALPVFFYAPYIPFEFVIGVWILVKGIQASADTASIRQMFPAGANS